MGGNALTQIKTVRKNVAEYKKLTQEVLTKLREYCVCIDLIPSYNNKDDFGDADILVVLKDSVKDLRQLLLDLFAPTQIVKNDKCYSFDFHQFQIDIICSTEELYKASYAYYSYNDLGNLIGRIAYNHNLKYGHKGLYLRLKGEEKSEILVSRDTSKILEFLGFDPLIFFKGFETKEDIFNYVINSYYFNKEYFSLENLNHINRTRNRKRKTYMDFLKYISENYNSIESKQREIKTLDNIIAFFPESNIINDIAEIERQQQDKKYIASKFNGSIVSTITNLKEKQLGNFIIQFKNSKKDFNDWVRNSNVEVIEEEIKNFQNE